MRVSTWLHGVNAGSEVIAKRGFATCSGGRNASVDLHPETWAEWALTYDTMGRPERRVIGDAGREYANASIRVGPKDHPVVEVVLYAPSTGARRQDDADAACDLAMQAYDRDKDVDRVIALRSPVPAYWTAPNGYRHCIVCADGERDEREPCPDPSVFDDVDCVGANLSCDQCDAPLFPVAHAEYQREIDAAREQGREDYESGRLRAAALVEHAERDPVAFYIACKDAPERLDGAR